MPLDIFVRFEPKPGKQGRLADELMLVPEPTRAYVDVSCAVFPLG